MVEGKDKAIKKLTEKAGLKSEDKPTDKSTKLDIMLSYEKKPYQSMAIGVHNEHFYFGSILDYGLKKVAVVVVDTGEIYWCWREKVDKEWIVDDEIRMKFGLNYRFELFDDCVDNLWSNKSINQFRKGEVKDITFEEMFNLIKDKNAELIYHPDKRVHDYIACDLISNYFYPLFNAKGRTYFQADFGSGKSRQSLIYQKLSFNSLFASNISPASFERVIESTGGTIIVDNFDNIQDDLKKQILQVIEVYYKKGGKNIKAAGQGREQNKPIAFNGYSPLVINNIVGLPEVTASRCNKIQMLKTEKKNIVDKRINEKDPFWNLTKDKLHILALQRWKEVRQVYDDLEVPELVARDLEKAEAVLTIAKLVGEETYKNVLSFLLESYEQQGIRDVQDNWEFILFDYLNENIKEGCERIKVRDITNGVAAKIVNNEKTEKTDKLKFSHYCGKVLSSIAIFPKKTIDGWVHYEISKVNLDKIVKIKKLDRYLTTPHPTPLNPTNNTNHTNNIINNNNNEILPLQALKPQNLSEVSKVSEVVGYPPTKKSKIEYTCETCKKSFSNEEVEFKGGLPVCIKCAK